MAMVRRSGRRNMKKRLLFAIVAATAFQLSPVSAQPSSTEPRAVAESIRAEAQPIVEATREQENTDLSQLLTVLVAVFTAAQVVIAVVAVGTSRAQLRAYVLLDKAMLTHSNPAPGVHLVAVQVMVRNFGQTPAFELSLASNGCFGIPDLGPPDFEKSAPVDQRNSKMILGPGAEIVFPPFSIELSEPDYRRLMKQQSRAYAWVVIDYRDAFGAKRQTRVFVRTEGQNVSPYKEGNEAT